MQIYSEDLVLRRVCWSNRYIHFEIIMCLKCKQKWTEKYVRKEISFLTRNVMFLIQGFKIIKKLFNFVQ